VCTVKSRSVEEDDLSVVEKTGHVGLVFEVTGVLCSCPAARGTIPVSAASGYPAVMLGDSDP
jgi:hypothetical protein